MDKEISFSMKPIGFVHTEAEKVPRHWSISDVEGCLSVSKEYAQGISDIKAGQKIVVLFCFCKSPAFDSSLHLLQTPPHKGERFGVFSICSPVRPNPIGMSVLDVLSVKGSEINVKGIDMLNNTPILDIKPYTESS